MNLGTYHREREYTKGRGYGHWTPGKLFMAIQKGPAHMGPNSLRPYPYFSLIERARQAWDVFTYRADALYWKEPTV